MPAVLRFGPYRFYFYSAEHGEPPHVHVSRDKNRAKIWLDPVMIAKFRGFKAHELNRLLKVVMRNQIRLLENWRVYFGE